MGIDVPPPPRPDSVMVAQAGGLQPGMGEVQRVLFREHKIMIHDNAFRRAEEGIPGKVPLFKLHMFDGKPELLQYVKEQMDVMIERLMKRIRHDDWSPDMNQDELHAALGKQVIEIHDYLRPIVGDNNIRPIIGGMVRCCVDACKEILGDKAPVPYPREVLHNIKKHAGNAYTATAGI